MKKLYFVVAPFIVLFCICTAFVSLKFHDKSSNGILSQTGSPGEGLCSGCHGGGPSATTISINATPSFSNNEFIQGQLYTITVTVAGSGYPKFGFGCEILSASTNTNAGLMQNPGSGVKLLTGGNGRRNAIQSTPKIGTGTADFTFDWIAPSDGIGVRIFAIGNCVNGNGNTSGDFARTISLTLSTPTITGVEQQKGLSLRNFQVFPNPVQDKINVSYGLSDPKHVKIQLSSVTGQIVAELLNEKQENGMYTKNLNVPSDVASGVYFLKILADNENVAQRLVVIK